MASPRLEALIFSSSRESMCLDLGDEDVQFGCSSKRTEVDTVYCNEDLGEAM